MVGIYRIHNKVNNLDYIGQSIHIKERWYEHRRELKTYKSGSPLYDAMRELGLENFEFTILEECSPQDLDAREKYWVAYYDAYENGYNQTPGGQKQIYDNTIIWEMWDAGKTVTQIAIELKCSPTTVQNYLHGYKDYNASTSHKRGGIQARKTAIANGKISADEELSPYKKNYRYDWKGNFLDEWKSTKEIQRKLNISGETVSWAIRGKDNRKVAGGYQWRLEKLDKIAPVSSKTCGQVVLCINTKEIYPSTVEASQSIGLKSKTGVLNSCNSYGTGNHSSAGKDSEGNKLYWKFLEDGDEYNS